MNEIPPQPGSLAAALAQIPDPRRAHLRVHGLVALLQFAVVAMRCGCGSLCAMAQRGRGPREGRPGLLVLGDALQTQRAVCEQICAAGGDYLLPVKENQPTLLADLEAAFSPTGARDAPAGERPPAPGVAAGPVATARGDADHGLPGER